MSLFAVSVEEGGSMTCKDTPLRQRGHMEVLQWLLGKQCGMGELARFRMDGEE